MTYVHSHLLLLLLSAAISARILFTHLQYEIHYLRNPQPASKRSRIRSRRPRKGTRGSADGAREGWCRADLTVYSYHSAVVFLLMRRAFGLELPSWTSVFPTVLGAYGTILLAWYQ